MQQPIKTGSQCPATERPWCPAALTHARLLTSLGSSASPIALLGPPTPAAVSNELIAVETASLRAVVVGLLVVPVLVLKPVRAVDNVAGVRSLSPWPAGRVVWGRSTPLRGRVLVTARFGVHLDESTVGLAHPG